MFKYLALFVLFSLAGWVIDTAYRSITTKKYNPNTVIPYFAPIYGFGGICLVAIFEFTTYAPVIQMLIGGITITLIELLGGLFTVHVMKKRLWDYSNNRLNFLGHIDALHTVYWFILAAAMIFILHQI